MTSLAVALPQRTKSISIICASLAGELVVAALVWFGLHEFAHLRLSAWEVVGVLAGWFAIGLLAAMGRMRRPAWGWVWGALSDWREAGVGRCVAESDMNGFITLEGFTLHRSLRRKGAKGFKKVSLPWGGPLARNLLPTQICGILSPWFLPLFFCFFALSSLDHEISDNRTCSGVTELSSIGGPRPQGSQGAQGAQGTERAQDDSGQPGRPGRGDAFAHQAVGLGFSRRNGRPLFL